MILEYHKIKIDLELDTQVNCSYHQYIDGKPIDPRQDIVRASSGCEHGIENLYRLCSAMASSPKSS